MKLKIICKKGILMLSVLIYLLVAGGINEVASKSLSQTQCGEWGLQLNGGKNTSQDDKISVEVLQSSDSNCVGKFLIKNETDFASMGGYSLELVPDPQNANFIIIDTHNILLPGAPLDIVVSPEDPGKAARVTIQGRMTLKSYGYDFAFFALISIMKQAMPACIVPNDLMARTALRTLNITQGASALFANGHVVEAYNEFSRVFETLIDIIAKELGPETLKNCGEDFIVKVLIGKKFEIFFDLIKWLAPWYRDYFEEEISYLTLSYNLDEGVIIIPEPTSQNPNTPTPGVEPIGGPSDPNYVYQQVKKTIENRDVSYLEEFYTGQLDINSSRITACSIDEGWVTPSLDVIEEHINGDLKCEGIQYESRLLTIYYSGWNPDWSDCSFPGHTSDTAGFYFYRTDPKDDFKLFKIQTSTMRAANARCCGNTGVEPYIVIPCDTQNIPNFEQAICPGALPQRLTIGGRGSVCSSMGYSTFHNTLPGDVDPSSPLIGQTRMPFGSEFEVLSGPYCIGDGLSWFAVWPIGKGGGYMAEGELEGDDYALCPLSNISTPSDLQESTPDPEQSSCPGAPPQRLVVGNRAKVCSSITSVKIRSTPGMSGSRITSLPSNTAFDVIGGPVCAGNNWSWWKVRTDSGQVGWMAEGGDEVDPYFLCPIDSQTVIPLTPTSTSPNSIVDTSDMLLIPPGEFQMGCDPDHNGGRECESFELPLHNVYLDAYYIDKTEVTNAEFAECVAAGACVTPKNIGAMNREFYYGNPEYADYPVTGKYWSEANDYCTWVGKRLPTEAEWEKAARGPTPRTYPWGDSEPNCDLSNLAAPNRQYSACLGDFNAYGNPEGTTNAVGSYPEGASPYGVLDMAGNVREWVSDWFSVEYYAVSPKSNPTGPTSGNSKVLRGGSFFSSIDSLSDRSSNPPDYFYFSYGEGIDYGFRCVYPVTQP